MTTAKKLMIGLGVAGGALLAAWLLTGDRGKKTKEFVSKKAEDLRQAFNEKTKGAFDDSDTHYV
ncbi:MAG: hypothetical protein DYG99_06925 [Bacteroidetes bacterium CHB5]|nr:hypothetical protein [Bacteroidetes bacterium CHB5]